MTGREGEVEQTTVGDTWLRLVLSTFITSFQFGSFSIEMVSGGICIEN